MTIERIGKRTMGVVIGTSRDVAHIADVEVWRDSETGEISEREFRPHCRRPVAAVWFAIPVQTHGVLAPDCKLCQRRIAPDRGLDLDVVNAALAEKFPDDAAFKQYITDPDYYFASLPESNDSPFCRAHQSDAIHRIELGEVGAYLTHHPEYPRVVEILRELPSRDMRYYNVADLWERFPNDISLITRMCTAAVGMRLMPSGKRRMPTDAVFHRRAIEASSAIAAEANV